MSVMQLKLNRQIKVPVYVQLKEQLKFLIASGEYPVGAQLPPAYQLADNLAINRNTVLKAYNELVQEGFVEFRNGVGTFVLAIGDLVKNNAVAPDLLLRLDTVLSDLLAEGLTSEQIANLALARAETLSVNRLNDLSQVRAAVFECNQERLDYYAETLRQGLEIEIRPFLIRQLTDGVVLPGLAEVDFIATSFFHFVEVRSKIRQLSALHAPEVFAITVRPHLDVLLALSKLPANASVGIVYFEGPEYTEQRLQAMVEHIENAHLQNVRQIEPVFVQGELDPARLRGFNAILIRPENLAATRRIIEVAIPTIPYENVVDQASLTMLRRIVHEVRENKLAAHQAKRLS